MANSVKEEWKKLKCAWGYMLEKVHNEVYQSKLHEMVTSEKNQGFCMFLDWAVLDTFFLPLSSVEHLKSLPCSEELLHPRAFKMEDLTISVRWINQFKP